MLADPAVVSAGDMEALATIDALPLSIRLSHDLDGVFAEVVAQFEGAVLTTALRVSGRRPDAEDLAAETFLKAYAGLRSYPRARIADLRLRPWLLTICLNLWRNQVRAASRRPATSPLTGADIATTEESPETQVERHVEGEQLIAALLRLPVTPRIAVVLRHIVGLSYAELAEILACPEGTAKSHVSRGLKRLRVLMTDPTDPSDVTDPTDAGDPRPT